MNKYGDYVLNEKEVVDVLYNNPNVDLTKLNITDVEKFNDAIANLYLANGKLEQYVEPNVSVEEFDKQYQQNWYMPQEYKELDIADLAPGIYYIKFNYGLRSIRKKFVKESI